MMTGWVLGVSPSRVVEPLSIESLIAVEGEMRRDHGLYQLCAFPFFLLLSLEKEETCRVLAPCAMYKA